jgi:predicted metalloprotease
MRWQQGRESDNVEDQRGGVPGGLILGGGGTLVVIILALLFGADPQALLQQLNQGQPPVQQGAPAPDGVDAGAEDELKRFVRVVLADTEDVWDELFQRGGMKYEKPKLVLFSGEVQSACGMASAAVGPFYCPEDERVYLDLSFFNDLKTKFNAPGDFPEAYVIAHEVGHHVQKLLGISDKVHAAQQRASEEQKNQLSVRLELQADFLAGVWAHEAQQKWNILEEGDIEQALACATAIGDDRLQKRARGYVVPDSFTHGTSAQRVRWFTLGLKTGDMKQGDTFSAKDL